MTSFTKRFYESLVRILVFATTYPRLFEVGSPTRRLLEQIEAAAQKLAVHKTSQTTGGGDLKTSTADRGRARAALRSQLDAIGRMARGLNLGQFWMSRDKSDRSLVEMGRIFASRAEPLKHQFIESHMAPDFIEQLNAAVQNLEKAIQDQVLKEGTRITATSAIAQARQDALSALRGLDPMMENLLRDDPPTLAVWQSARRVERYASPRRVQRDTAVEDPPLRS